MFRLRRFYGIHLLLVSCLLFVSLGADKCDKPDDVHKFKSDLLKASQTLNTGAKTNHTLYESKTYGTGPQAIEIRQKVATGIHLANDYLIATLDFAKPLNADTFLAGKQHVLDLLSQALTELAKVKIGKPEIDIVIQSAVLLINDAVILVNAFKGGQ